MCVESRLSAFGVGRIILSYDIDQIEGARMKEELPQSQFASEEGSFGAAGNTEFGQHFGDVGLDGAFADSERGSDLRIRLAFNNQGQYFSFAQGEGFAGGGDKERFRLGVEVEGVQTTAGEIWSYVSRNGRFQQGDNGLSSLKDDTR